MALHALLLVLLLIDHRELGDSWLGADCASRLSRPLLRPFSQSSQREWSAPNQKWSLFLRGCWRPEDKSCGDVSDLHLALVDLTTSESREVLAVNSPPIVSWAPDSDRFFIVNHESSDRDNSYIYSAKTLTRLDIGQLILMRDQTLANYARQGSHLYFVAKRWRDSQAVEVRVTGHTDSPAKEFTRDFVVTADASVTRLD